MPSPAGVAATLEAWIRAHGGSVGAFGVALDAEGRRGAVAISDLEAGETLLEIPRACMMAAGALDDPTSRRIRAGWLGPSQEHVLLAAALLGARRAHDPRWAPYLRSLPGALPEHPLAWDAARRAEIAGSTFATLLAEREALFEEELTFLHLTCPELAGLSAGMWRLARSLVSSRAFSVTLEGVEQSALVPYADLLNHAHPPQTRWGMEGERFFVRTREAVAVGSPLHNSYGARSNGRLLLHYGFTLADNPLDDALIDLGGAGRHRLSPRWDAEAGALFAGVRESVATLEERAEVARRGGGTGQPVSPRNERLTVLLLASEARRRRAALPAPPTSLDAARVVAEERRALDWLIGLAPLAIAALDAEPSTRRAMAEREENKPYADYLRALATPAP